MKKRLSLSILLLVVVFFIPLNITYIYFQFYNEADLLGRKHFSEFDDDNFLNLSKENSQDLIPPDQFSQWSAISFCQEIFGQTYFILPSGSTHFILRC